MVEGKQASRLENSRADLAQEVEGRLDVPRAELRFDGVSGCADGRALRFRLQELLDFAASAKVLSKLGHKRLTGRAMYLLLLLLARVGQVVGRESV